VKIEQTVFEIQSIFSNKNVLVSIVSNQNLHGERHIGSALVKMADKPKPTEKDTILSIEPRNEAFVNGRTIVLNNEVLSKHQEMYDRTYALCMAFAKVQILPGRNLKTFSWKGMDDKSKKVYALMFEHLLAKLRSKYGNDHVIPLHACLKNWASSRMLSKVISSMSRSSMVCSTRFNIKN